MTTKKKSAEELARETQLKQDWEATYEKALDFSQRYGTVDRIESALALGLRFKYITQAEYDSRLLQHCTSPAEGAILRLIEKKFKALKSEGAILRLIEKKFKALKSKE